MNTSVTPMKLGETQPEFQGVEFPITRQMYHAWQRFVDHNTYHLETRNNRASFIQWYLFEMLPTLKQRPIFSKTYLENITSIEKVAPNRLSKLMYFYWFTKHRNTFDIASKDGYDSFLLHWIFETSSKNCFQITPSGIRQYLKSISDDSNFEELPLSIFLSTLMKQPGGYKDTYKIEHLSQRAALSLDVLCQFSKFNQVDAVLYPELLEFWYHPMFAEDFSVSRLRFALTKSSAVWNNVVFDYATYRDNLPEIQNWQKKIINSNPGLEKLLDTEGVELKKQTDTKSKNLPLLISGPYSIISGLSSSMHRTSTAVQQAGVQHKILDTHCGLLANFPAVNKVPQDLIYNDEHHHISLLHLNAETIPDICALLPDIWNNSEYRIGYFYWETALIPEAHKTAFQLLDEIWVASEFVKSAYQEFDGPVINVGTCLDDALISNRKGREYFDLTKDEFVFLFSFDGHSVMRRKNPHAVVKAFLKAFPNPSENVKLIIKTRNAASATWSSRRGSMVNLQELVDLDNRIILIDQTFSKDEYMSLKAECDCYISLHRSEGFGYGPAEAMALGKSVIVSDYSSTQDFCNPTNSYLVSGKEVFLAPDDYIYWTPGMKWFEPSVDDAAEQMRAVFDNPEKAKKIAGKGKKTVASQYSITSFSNRILKRLKQIKDIGH